MIFSAAAIPIRPMGTFSRKIQCHEAYCTILATTSIGRFCAVAHNSEPAINTAIEPTNTLRVPKRSAR